MLTPITVEETRAKLRLLARRLQRRLEAVERTKCDIEWEEFRLRLLLELRRERANRDRRTKASQGRLRITKGTVGDISREVVQ